MIVLLSRDPGAVRDIAWNRANERTAIRRTARGAFRPGLRDNLSLVAADANGLANAALGPLPGPTDFRWVEGQTA